MPSFTSSFKSLCAAVAWRVALLVAAYGIFVALVRPTVYLNLSDAGTQNRIVAERFLAFGKAETPRAVLVGSSMGRHLESGLAEVDPGIYDLALFGGSPLTGNELMLQSGRLPRVVVIEVNNLRQPLDTPFVLGAMAEPGAALRRICPALRTEYQPLRVLQSAGRTLGAWGKPPHPVPDKEEPTPRLDEGVAFFVRGDDRTGADERERVRLDLAALGAQVERLEARGVQVLFVSLPTDPRVEGDAFRRFVHREALARFPEAEWPWLDFPSDGSFRTTDGVHLTESSARRAAALIAEKVRSLLAHSRS